MSKKKLTKDEAINYCMEQIEPGNLSPDEYLKLRQYKFRYNKGELKDKAIKTLFDRFGITENCYYTLKSK